MKRVASELTWWLMAFLLLAAVTALPGLQVADAAITPAQRREHTAIKILVRRAEQRYKQGELAEAGDLVQQAQRRLEQLLGGADEDLQKRAKATHQELTKIHGSLEFDGISLTPLKPIDEMTGRATGSVGFAKQVAPILISKCGRCHIDRQQGEFGMATFADLMKGTSAGAVVLPKDDVGSRLVEVIETGDMPRGGVKVTPKELATLKLWIREGARFDGEDRTKPLTGLAPDARPAKPPAPKVEPPTGDEKISFSRDLATVLSRQCARCHGDGQPVRARLNVTTFRTLLRGGDNGAPIRPGAADESLLLQKLKGTADGNRMPQGQPPLSDEVIAKFETWINEGARFDGRDPNQQVSEIAAVAKAMSSTHEQLRADRAELALANWQLVLPDRQPQRVDTDHFLLLGNVSSSRLTQYGSRADAVVTRVEKLFRASSNRPFIKGGMTIYVFERNYDYGEFGRMVEKRELPLGSRAHWRFSIVDAYAALQAPRSDDDALEALLVEQVAGVYVASLGNAPQWFYEGVARTAAARIAPRSARVMAWNERAGKALAKMKSPDDFLKGRTTAEDAEVLAFSYARLMMSDSRRFQKLLRGMQEGDEFSAAFSQSYGTSPDQWARLWAARELQKGRRGGRR